MVILFCVLYFGMKTKPKKQIAFEKSRATNIEATGIQNVIMDAKKELTTEQLNIIEAMQSEYNNAKDDKKIIKAELLASKWYEYKKPTVSGYYAEKIANTLNTKDAWSIAGTTYSLAMQNAKSEKELKFSRGRAIKALEKAISLEDNNISDKINLALIYVDHPDKSPMEGIQMLLKLNQSNPDNVAVINQLAKLAIRTNQTEKALKRLTHALSVEPENNNSICLIAEVYSMIGNKAKAIEFQNKCKK